ncbi:MAG: signal peptidase I [Actinobacteria bacterium]|nr:signal peptidase I [Actinomycetota bacterium]
MKRRTIAEYLLVALCAIVVALLVQAFLIKPYRIPSESMAATLVPRDRVLVNRVVYRLHAPGRGDIVVIDSAAVGRILIKRVVALPGETVSVAGGTVYIDGRRLEEPYVHRVDGETEPTEPFRGTGQAWSLERPYTVPPGHFFLMGDNRAVSDDSRDWGPAPRREIIGEAFLTYWPLSRLHGL